jgi:hypothetical protein
MEPAAMTKFLPVFAIALALPSIPLAALAAPRVINTCMTITDPGPYVVGRNLGAAGDCLVVAADNVSIDLDGFVLSGNGTGSGVVEQLAVGRKGVTVRNGVITGFLRAVYMGNSHGMAVDSINAHGNMSNAITVGDNATVTRNRVTGNNGVGILAGFRSLVTGNGVDDNSGSGIYAGIGANVTGNTVGHNGATGISVSEGALVSGNVSRNNSSYGISADCPSLVIGNTSTNNLAENLHAVGGACDPNSQACCVLGVNNMSMQ